MNAMPLLLSGWLFPALACSGVLKYEPEDARRTLATARAVVEARPLAVKVRYELPDGRFTDDREEAEKVRRGERTIPGKVERRTLEDGTVVTVAEPDIQIKGRPVAVRVHYEVAFEVTKIFHGAVEPGRRFTRKWQDVLGSMCPHLETRMIDGPGVWYFQARPAQARPLPGRAGQVLLSEVKRLASGRAGKTESEIRSAEVAEDS